MNQVWLPLERNEPDLRLWSLNVIASLRSEIEKMTLIVGEKASPGFLPSHEQDESTALLRDVKKKSREEAEDGGFSLLRPRKALQ